MNLISVKSSNISQIGFDENHQVSFNQKPTSVLEIVFNNGRIYDYYAVPKETYEEMIKAESIGKYFHANIVDKFKYERIK